MAAGRSGAAARARRPSTPSRARSAAAKPSTATTSSLARTVRAGDVPVSRSASRRPSRSGSSHSACSSVANGSGNVSAIGPGPNTVPDVGGSVVIGRACSRCRRAVRVDGPLDVLRSGERPAGVLGEAGQATQHVRRRTRRVAGGTDLDDAAAAVEHTRPAVRRAGDELVRAARDRGDDHPVVASGQRIGAEEHAAPGGDAASAARARPSRRRRDRRDGPGGRTRGPRSTAASTAASPDTSRTDSNTPAIDDASPSSPVDDERTTTGVSPSADTARHAATASSIECPVHAVVSTAPGSVGRPAARASARLAALAPTSDASVARGSESLTTGGRAACSTSSTSHAALEDR